MRAVLSLLLALMLPAPAAEAQTQTPTQSQMQAQTQAPPVEVLADVRVHGNHATPDADIIALTGLTLGQPVAADLVAQITQRLKATHRFEEVEVRKRYRSLTDLSQIALIVLVQEYPTGDPGIPIPGAPHVPIPGPLRRLRNALMLMPVLDYSDGYGFTYGGRATFVDTIGKHGRISVPLTWGGTKRAAVEVEKAFDDGLVSRVVSRITGGVAVSRRENPFFELNDSRRQIWAAADRAIVDGVRVGLHGGWTDVGFGPSTNPLVRLDDRFTTIGTDVIVDTRHDPIFPRNAVYARAGWESLDFDRRPKVNRYQTEIRGYLGLVGQSVLSVRARSDRADRPLPPYEQALLGGASTLRGFRAGSFAGDNRFTSSAELRVPLTSPMKVGKLGVNVFVDAGTVYDEGERLRDATFHRGAGAGLFFVATIFQLNIDVAHGVDSGTRVHLMTGFQF
jgi:outer membrane protein assembly factor BamA